MAKGIFESNPYYWGTIRNFIISFGSLFSGMTITNKSATGKREQVIKVPIAYGPKHKWLDRLKEQPKPEKGGIAHTLPRLAFEITDYKYDAARKIGTQGNSVTGRLGTQGAKIFNPVPYDVTIQLYSLAKDNDDSLKILEQILPYFAPHMDLTFVILPQFNIKKTVPVVLETVSVTDTYDGLTDEFRAVTQTFTFTAKLDLFGPIHTGSVIKSSNVEISITEGEAAIETLNFAVNPQDANRDDPHVIVETRTFNL
jgi:hypothetical protein